MNKKNIGIISGVVAAVLLVAALLGAYYLFGPGAKPDPVTPTSPADGESGVPFTLVVVHADGSEKTFKFRSDKTYVGEVLLAEGIVEGEAGDYGLYIKVVDGEKAVWEEDQAYWSFYVGDVYATTGVDTTPIEEGKVYKLVYTKE